MRSWWFGTNPGEAVSMGVISDNNPYGIPENINFSFPVQCKDGNWEIVKGFKFDSFSEDKIQKTKEELLRERQMALGF